MATRKKRTSRKKVVTVKSKSAGRPKVRRVVHKRSKRK